MSMIRWIDLSEYNMRLYVAVLPNSKVLVVDKVPVEYHTEFTALGFKERPNGSWVKTGAIQPNPREFMRYFPNVKVAEMKVEDVLVKFDQPTPDTKQSSVSSDLEIETIVLGLNRHQQTVIEEAGHRYVVDRLGRRIKESGLSTSMPSMFLRAVDDLSLAQCAEGYIETALNLPKAANSHWESFVKTIGISNDQVASFKSHVSEAALRNLGKKNSVSMRDKYLLSIEFSRVLREIGVSNEHLDNVVIGRRLLGSDRELIGNSIYVPTDGNNLIQSLLPQAVRYTNNVNDADYMISHASDLPVALTALQNRAAGSLTASFIKVSGATAAQEAIGKISEHNSVEAAAYVEIGSSQHLVVTSYAGASGISPSVKIIKDAAELWSWSSVTVSDRTRAINASLSGLGTSADLNASMMVKNSHQVPYKSASKSGTPITMVPKELDEATREALERVSSSFQNVDERVANECGFPRGKISSYLSPEQVDGVALAIHAEERNRGFLLADNTGVGKGRTLMSLAKRAVLQGRKVLVLTEQVTNLSDLMRDLKHIKALDIIKPAVFNSDALIDEATGKPFELADRAILDEAIINKNWPDSIPVVFATYSQFNQMIEDSEKSSWLRQVIDENVTFIGDEIHCAVSGNSNTSENIAAAVKACGTPIYSSATFAGDAKTMSFFERLFPEEFSSTEIASMMRKGGEPFQEVVSSMLVADGVMIRREKDLSELEISQHLDVDRVGRNREHMDALAAVIGEMASLSGEMDVVVSSKNSETALKSKGIQLKRAGFGSPLYMMTRLFTAALLAEFVAERAILALQNNEKPVILVENTLQAVLKEAEMSTGDAPDFKSVLHRVLNQLTRFTVLDENGHIDRLDATEGNDVMRLNIMRIRELIDLLPDLPASSIDVVKQKITDAGFSCGEITGRVVEVVNGKVVKRKDRNSTLNKNAFNRGDLDALVINTSGSTGIDLHASLRFKDQRRRVMIELQGPSSVQKQIQAFGRISRYDEVVPSRIEVPSTGLPVEVRLSAMRNQKLRRLSANVTSSRDSAYLTKNIPDLINSVGDTVISRYADMRPDLVKKLCLSYADRDTINNDNDNENKTESLIDSDRSGNEFLSRLALLPTEHQEKILAEITAEYELHIEELEAKGENPLRPKEMEGVVHFQSSHLFEGMEDSGDTTAFDGPMHIRNIMIERVTEPIRSEMLMTAVEEGANAFYKAESAAEMLVKNRDIYLQTYIPKSSRNVEEAIRSGHSKTVSVLNGMNDIISSLKSLTPGREIEMTWPDEEKETAIITGIIAPPAGYEHLPNLYSVSLARPGETKISNLRLGTLLYDLKVGVKAHAGQMTFNVKDGLTGSNYDHILESFERASATKRVSGKILSTNLFRAVRLAAKHNLGSLVSFVDSDGNRHRGVLVKKGFENKLEKLSVRIDGVQQTLSALVDVKAEVTSSATGSKSAVFISPSGQSEWMIKLPKPRAYKGSIKWPSEEYKALFMSGNADLSAQSMILVNGYDDLESALGTLSKAGFSSFYADGKHRGRFIDENERQKSLLECRP